MAEGGVAGISRAGEHGKQQVEVKGGDASRGCGARCSISLKITLPLRSSAMEKRSLSWISKMLNPSLLLKASNHSRLTGLWYSNKTRFPRAVPARGCNSRLT